MIKQPTTVVTQHNNRDVQAVHRSLFNRNAVLTIKNGLGTKFYISKVHKNNSLQSHPPDKTNFRTSGENVERFFRNQLVPRPPQSNGNNGVSLAPSNTVNLTNHNNIQNIERTHEIQMKKEDFLRCFGNNSLSEHAQVQSAHFCCPPPTGLVSQDEYKEIVHRNQFRKRRSTANPHFSKDALEAKKSLGENRKRNKRSLSKTLQQGSVNAQARKPGSMYCNDTIVVDPTLIGKGKR